MKNIFTVDLEDWYQGQSYRSRIPLHAWSKQEDRIVPNTLKLVNLFNRTDTKATFFMLGYNAQRYPELVRIIKKEGHEIGVHGYYHNMVYQQSPYEFEQEIDFAKKVIEDVSGDRVIGFRAPNWSINATCLWAMEILLKLGFKYDSSLDYSSLQRICGQIPTGLIEIPRSDVKCLNFSIPFAGGFYFRAYPYCLTKFLLEQRNRQDERVLVYVHPWELESEVVLSKPCFLRGKIKDFRLRSFETKIVRLLNEFSFDSIKALFFE
jgi:polysaccharide deacetylase family protein (PEP-CTERM system associated)